MLDRTCFRIALGDREVDNQVYEYLRSGQITCSLLLKESARMEQKEQNLLNELSPELVEQLRNFAKTVCG